MSQFSELAAARYSVRSFADTPVEQEKIAQLLELVRVAPTAHNNQPQRLMVITEPDRLALIDECTPCRFGAPLVIAVCYDDDECWVRPFDGAKSGEVDASVIATHLVLGAADMQLGSVWVMYFDAAKLRELFELPSAIAPVALLPIGYPAPDAEPNPRHTIRKPLEALLLP